MKECQAAVDSSEFAEWKVVFRLRILEEADDRRAALMAFEAHHANPFGKPVYYREFLPKVLREQEPTQSEASMKQQFRLAKSKWPK